MHHICIITPDYLASTPRVVKEATALAQAGYAVRIVHSRGGLAQWRKFDADIVLPAEVRRTVIGWSAEVPAERDLYQRSRWRHRLWRSVPLALRAWPGIAERVLGRLYQELSAAACAEVADLYIGHYPAGLAAAARAAKRHAALLGFDSEDLHAEESPPASAATCAWVTALEQRCLPRCAHLSAASMPIAEALVQHYGCAMPVVVRNTFPEPAPAHAPLLHERGNERLALYWFSQTIGGGRGLEWALAALGRVQGDIRLYLRGEVSNTERARLLDCAAQHGCSERMVFLPPVAPERLHMANLQFDVGLALERTLSRSRDLTVTNKLYQYLQAGLLPIASRTRGQQQVLADIGLLDCVVPEGDVDALTALIQRLHDQPAWLQQLRERARRAATAELAHPIDQQALLTSVRTALARRSR